LGIYFYTNNIFRNANSRARKGAFEREITSKKKKLVKEREKKLCAKKKELFPEKLGFTFFERYVKRFCVKERKSFPKKLGFSFLEKRENAIL
jgi:dTDP-glucose pyrophosphorylase